MEVTLEWPPWLRRGFVRNVVLVPDNSSITEKVTIHFGFDDIVLPETLFPSGFYEGGKYNIKWSNGLKLHKTSQLRSTDLFFPPNRYKPIPLGRQLNYDELFSDIKPYNKFNVELRYVPGKEWIVFEYVNIIKENQTKSEYIHFDLTEKIGIDFLEISTKVQSLCNCKTSNQYAECIDEAERITSQYIKMFSLFANNPESWGLLEIDATTRSRIDAQNFYDFHSGWLCYQ